MEIAPIFEMRFASRKLSDFFRLQTRNPSLVSIGIRRSRPFYVKIRRFLVLQLANSIANVYIDKYLSVNFKFQKSDFEIWL